MWSNVNLGRLRQARLRQARLRQAQPAFTTEPELAEGGTRASRQFVLLYLSLCIAIFIMLLSGCGTSDDDAWESIAASGRIRVGLDPTFPPFENGDTGDLHGIDVDLAEAIGRELGLEIEFVYHGYDGLYDALQTRQVDMLASALVIDAQKTKLFSYSEPYFNAGQFLVVHADNRNIIEPDNLSGLHLAVEIGSEGHVQLINEQRRVEGLDIKTLPTPDDALWVTLQKEVDGAIVDQINARLYKQTFPELYLVDQPLTVEPFALVTRIEDQELLERLDESLEKIEQSGELDQILTHWLDSSNP